MISFLFFIALTVCFVMISSAKSRISELEKKLYIIIEWAKKEIDVKKKSAEYPASAEQLSEMLASQSDLAALPAGSYPEPPEAPSPISKSGVLPEPTEAPKPANLTHDVLFTTDSAPAADGNRDNNHQTEIDLARQEVPLPLKSQTASSRISSADKIFTNREKEEAQERSVKKESSEIKPLYCWAGLGL